MGSVDGIVVVAGVISAIAGVIGAIAAVASATQARRKRPDGHYTHLFAWVVVGVLAASAALGLFWLAPWKLSPTGDTLVAKGTFISLEHQTSGSVSLVRLADGRTQLVIENLSTSDGPDLHIWLTDQQVNTGISGWYVYDDGRYVELGALKDNRGNQVYDVPAGTDLTGLRSVSIWCKRFAVGFGAAELAPA
jgi:hypothetical protein